MRNSYFMFLVAALLCGAPDSTFAQSDAFDSGTWTFRVPKGWTTGGNATLDYGTHYGGVPDGKRAAVVWSRKKLSENDFGTLMQTISAEAYRGRRARVSAMLSAEQALDAGRVALWMRVNDETGKAATFDSMETRSIAAGTGWKRYDIVLDVPDRAVSITFGVLLAGRARGCCFGRVMASDFRLEPVGSDVAVTATPATSLPDAPVNADFSEK